MKRLIQALTAACFVAKQTTISGMGWYDGIDHNEYFDAVRVYIGYNDRAELASIVKRLRVYTLEWIPTAPGTHLYRIMRTADRERLDEFDTISKRFQEAFWTAIHNGLSQSEAITAGREAIA